MTHDSTSRGFTLSIVLILSTALMIVAVALLQTVSITRKDSVEQYYTKMAEEAAEAGAALAQACLEESGHEQTWGPSYFGGARPNLIPSSNCNGTANSFPSNTYVYTDNYLQTRFVVGDLEESEINSAVISVIGYTEVKQYGTSTVVKTYTHVIKKTIVWPADLEAQKSASGQLRTCGVLSGDAYCWGDNDYGQLGDGSTTASLVPVKVHRDTYPTGIGDYAITDIAAGDLQNCLLIETGEVYCWGRNDHGQLAQGSLTPTQSTVPIKATGLGSVTVKDVGVSGDAFCALTTGDALYCWGSNVDSQVGNNSTTDRTTPILIGGPSGGYGGLANKAVTEMSQSGAFNNHMCAVATGLAYCWGRNNDGQIGNNPSGTGPWTTDLRTPTAVYTSGVLSGKTVVAITGDGGDGDAHTCAMAYTTTTADMRAYCWGANTDGFLGSGAAYNTTSKVPVAVSVSGVLASKVVTEVAVGAVGACVIAYPTSGTIADSRAYCWGAASVRGDGVNSRTNIPVQVDDTGTVFNTEQIYGIISGAYRACAIALNKSYCWGVNSVGQIGDGTTVSPRRQPTESLYLRPDNNEYIF